MAYGEYVSVTPFFNWVHYGTPVPHSVFLRMVEAGSATFLSNRGSGLDFSDQSILENRHKGEAIAYSLNPRWRHGQPD
ncbi:hypothetical protein ULG90_03785 [Halopseudomonas pachastrellae]|nr:hypothetical protein ULG90_03785 [Halopseudomonas pachastrellae]